MAEVTELREAVSGLVRDGDAVALEGFTHLIPTAGAHEIMRQGRAGDREPAALSRAEPSRGPSVRQ